MSNQYGTPTVKWSTATSPKLFSGIAENYNYRHNAQKSDTDNDDGERAISVLHGLTGDISFEVTITDASTDLPDLLDGSKITVVDADNISGGTVLLTEIVERWQLGSDKMASARATHYPLVVGGAGAAAGTYSGVSPVQVAPPIIIPGGSVVWGTKGLTSALGIVQSLTVTQTVQHKPEPDEAGQIVQVTTHGYFRRIALEVVAKGDAVCPAIGTTLAVTGAPAHAAGAFVTGADDRRRKGQKGTIAVEAEWFPAMAA